MTKFFAACESIKDGKAWDPRHRFQAQQWDRGNVVVFWNAWPDLRTMSRDRWWFLDIQPDGRVAALDELQVQVRQREEARHGAGNWLTPYPTIPMRDADCDEIWSFVWRPDYVPGDADRRWRAPPSE